MGLEPRQDRKKRRRDELGNEVGLEAKVWAAKLRIVA